MDWKKRNCFCDNSCAVYGDCCIDAPAYSREEQMVRNRSASVTEGRAGGGQGGR